MLEYVSTYVHDWDPIIWQISDTIALRWYGLAYLSGFVIGFLLLRYLSKKDLYPIAENKLGDFITLIAIFGVLLGGRLGYVLFYMIPNEGIDVVLKNPLVIIEVWKGGMASHGGILGVLICSGIYAWKKGYNWVSLMDGLAIVAPVGLFFGRVANFINGELYGRVVSAGSQAGMIFPTELASSTDSARLAQANVWSTMEQHPYLLQALQSDGLSLFESHPYDIVNWMTLNANKYPELQQALIDNLPERYPSQLYEALSEGLIIFVVLWLIRIYWKKAYNGIFCGVFLLLYTIGRYVSEEFREPDSPFSLGMTRGQFLSLFLLILAAAFFVYAFKTKKTVKESLVRDLAEEK